MKKLFTTTILLCAAASAQQPANFSGTWILNAAASDYSNPNANKPDRLSIVAQQKGNSLKYRVEREKDGKKGSFDVDLTIGGEAYESDAAGVVTAEWKGDKLQVTTLYNPGQERQSDQVEMWSISADGKQLTDEMKIHPPNHRQEVQVRRVFDKKG